MYVELLSMGCVFLIELEEQPDGQVALAGLDLSQLQLVQPFWDKDIACYLKIYIGDDILEQLLLLYDFVYLCLDDVIRFRGGGVSICKELVQLGVGTGYIGDVFTRIMEITKLFKHHYKERYYIYSMVLTIKISYSR